MSAPFATPSLRYLSVCSGIEAASVAWEPLGWTPVAFAEIDPAASRLLARRFPQVPNLGDMTTIDVARLGPVDVLVGGTPCQAFSMAGRRRSLADARGSLSLAYAVLAHDLVRCNGLRWAVWENVPGVLSTADNAFGCLLGALVGGDDPVLPLPRPRDGTSNAFWRWRRAGVERDDEGNETVVEPGHVTRWPCAGMVAGPLGRAAWRVLDAQYFGLAQRRRRVLVVVGLGDGADPAAVLFEPQGLRRHPPSRGEAGEGVARPLAAGSPGGSGYRNDADTADNLIAHTLRGEGFDASEDGTGRGVPLVAHALRGQHNAAHREDQDTLVPVAFGGNDTRGPLAVAAALNAHGGPQGRQDFASETFVVATTLRARDGAKGVDSDCTDTLLPICLDPRQADVLVHGDRTGPLDTQFPGPAIAFDTTQITSATNRCNPQPGDPRHPLAAGAHPPAIAFQGRGTNLDDGGDHANAGGQVDVSFGKPCSHASVKHASASEAYTSSPLRALRLEVGEETFAEWGLGVSDSLQSPEILRSGVHGARLRRTPCKERPLVVDCASPLSQACGTGTVSEVRSAGRERRPSQEWRLSKQLAGQFGTYLSKLPHQRASEARLLHDLWEASEGLGFLRQALSALQEVWRSTENENKSTHANWAVRRLTPKECERLMGFPDGWTAGQADGPRYKQLGNSKPTPVVRWLGARIAAVEAASLEAAE